jgi:hypothetical protein
MARKRKSSSPLKLEYSDGTNWYNLASEDYVLNNSVQSVSGTSDRINVSGELTPVIDLAPSGVVAGTYYNLNAIIDDAGRITAAVSGSGGAGINSLTGFVNGSNPFNGVLTTTIGAGCLLSVIPAGGNVNLGNFAINNLALPSNSKDGLSFDAMWQITNDLVI